MSHPARKELCSTLVPTLLAAVALSLSAYAVFHCNFVAFVIPPATRSHEQAGLWRYQWWDHGAGRYACRAYPASTAIDVWWQAARGLSALTLLLGGVAVTRACVLTCGTRGGRASSSTRTRGWRSRGTVGGCYLAAAVGASLSLLFLRGNACRHNAIFNLMRDHDCRASTGARCTFAAMGLWWAASSLVLLADETTEEEDGGAAIQQHSQPLLQDVILECEQSTYSGREGE